MSNTINEVVCLLPNSSLADQTGRLWNYRNNGGIQFFEMGGVFDQPYIKFTDKTLNKNYLYTRTVEDDNNDFRLGDNFTIEFWVRNIIAPSSTWSHLLCYHPDNSTGSGWSIAYNSTDKCMFFINPSYGTYTCKSSQYTAWNDWTHVAFVKNKANMACFVNGVRTSFTPNQPNTYMIDSNIKDGLYLCRSNTSYVGDTSPLLDFGGLKISKYARYNIEQTNVDILDFNLDSPTNSYNGINKRNDKLNLYLETYSPLLNSATGVVWINHRDNKLHTNIDSVTSFQPYYTYNNNDRSVKSTSKKSSDASINLSSFGSIINNIDQDYMVIWDLYIAPEWCDLTKNPNSKKMNLCWENSNVVDSEKVILWYGRDSTSVEKSFYSIGYGSYTTEPVEANRKYFDFKFIPDVRYRIAMSYKNHKKHFYIDGKRIHTRNMSNYFNAGTALYGTFQDFNIGGSDVINEINYCTKLDNIWIKVGSSVDTDIYDYNNDEYDYDFNINNDSQKYGIQSTLNNVFNADNNIETWNKIYNLKYTNTNTISNIDSTTFAIEDINDTRKVDEFTLYLEGKRNNKNEIINVLGSNYVYERLIKSPNVISKVKSFNINNNIKFINKDELIIQDKNINVALGYLTGELEQTECKTNGYYIKVFNHNTNRFIGEYEIINGVFTIDNLNYYEYYDVVLCDRLNKIENQVMSKRKPTLYNNDDILTKVYSNNYIDTLCVFDILGTVNVEKTTIDLTKLDSLPSQFSLSRSSIATYINSSGVLTDSPINTARFDYGYDINSNKFINKGLLVEVASTNILLNGRNFSGWNMNISTSVSNDTSIKRIDNTDSLKTVFTANAGAGYYNGGANVTSNQYYTVSVLLNTTYSTQSDTLKVNLGHYQLGGEATVVNFSNNTVTNNSLIQNSGFINITKDWERGYYTVISSGSSNASMVFYNGDNITKTIYHDLYQVENLPYATSFIKTTGSVASRSKDILTVVSDDLYTASIMYTYINQSNPTEIVNEIIDHVNSKLIPLPNGFVSGWLQKISIYERLLTDAEKADLIFYLSKI